MPDTVTANAVRPLSPDQRDAVRVARGCLRLAADRLDEALAAGRADYALDACDLAADAGLRVRFLRELLK